MKRSDFDFAFHNQSNFAVSNATFQAGDMPAFLRVEIVSWLLIASTDVLLVLALRSRVGDAEVLDVAAVDIFSSSSCTFMV